MRTIWRGFLNLSTAIGAIELVGPMVSLGFALLLKAIVTPICGLPSPVNLVTLFECWEGVFGSWVTPLATFTGFFQEGLLVWLAERQELALDAALLLAPIAFLWFCKLRAIFVAGRWLLTRFRRPRSEARS